MKIRSSWLAPLWTQTCAAGIGVVSIIGFWNFAQGVATTAIFCVLYGIAGGCLLGSQLSSITGILTKARHNCAGSWLGMMWVVSAPFAVTGPTVGGELRGKYGQQVVGYFSTACFAVASLSLGASALNERQRKRDQHQSGDEKDIRLEIQRRCDPCIVQGHV